MFLCEKIRSIRKKSNENLQKTAISGIFPVFSTGKKNFSTIGLGHVLSILNTHFFFISNQVAKARGLKFADIFLLSREVKAF